MLVCNGGVDSNQVFTWHVGEVTPFHKHFCWQFIDYLWADGEEKAYVEARFPRLPVCTGTRLVLPSEQAQFVAINLTDTGWPVVAEEDI